MKNLTLIPLGAAAQISGRILNFAFCVLILLIGCGSEKFESKPLDREIVVDGQLNDWQGATTYFEQENVTVGMLNDRESLYLTIASDEPQIRNQMMMRGMTLWLDPKGGKDKKFGIRFPLGMIEAGMPEIGRLMRRGEGELDLQRIEEAFDRSLAEIEIIGPGKGESRRLERSNATGIVVAAKLANSTMIYEIKVPLQSADDHLYAIGTAAGKTIGVGLETPELDMQAMREQMHGQWGGGGMGGGRPPGGMGGGRPPGGMGGGGGRPPGGMMGGFGGKRPESPKPLNVWAKVKLAE